MKIYKPTPTYCGGIVTAVSERAVWDVIFDDDGDTEESAVVSKNTITIVGDPVETASNTWSLVLSDDASTPVTGLTKTGAPTIASSTQDGSDSDVFDCVVENGQAAVVAETGTGPIVGSFVYHAAGNGSNHHDPTYLHCTAAVFAKWILA